MDNERLGQGLWFLRRGAYLTEIRVTFEPSLVEDVLGLVATLTDLPAAREIPGWAP